MRNAGDPLGISELLLCRAAEVERIFELHSESPYAELVLANRSYYVPPKTPSKMGLGV